MPKPLRIIVLIIASAVFIFSSSRLAWNFYQMAAGSSAYEDIRQEVVEEVFFPEIAEEKEAFSTLAIDFDTLFGINTDIIGWLYMPDTPVSYPLLQGRDNHLYLNTTFDKRSNVLGSIFMDYRNNAEFSDINTIIYGHNTTNDSMFGSLKKFKEQSYADERLEFHVIRADEVRVYEIFSIYEILATSDTYTIGFQSAESYEEYIREITSRSVVSVGSPPDLESIVTLSTCTGGDRAMRLVIHGKFIDSHSLLSRDSNASFI